MRDAYIGQRVSANYKSGKYIGEVVEDRGKNYLVKVLAVKKHPIQGDLHNPGETENVFFHQRKALSYQEKMNVPKSAVQPYEGELPDYKDSLRETLKELERELEKSDTEFNRKARENLADLEKWYF